MPLSAAGWRIEPPVSVPVAIGTRRAATAAAEPPEEPPGTRRIAQGFLTGPKYELSLEEPIANSSMLHLPSSTAPARPNCSTTCASYGLVYFSSMREAQVVGSARVQKMSLCAMGMPVSGPASPFARRSSARFAASMLISSSTVMKALSSRYLSILSRWARVNSTAETFFADKAAESSVTLALSTLLENFGHEIEPPLYGRRHRLEVLA